MASSIINLNIHKYGYHIFPRLPIEHEIEEIILGLREMNVRRTPLNEQERSIWWNEIEVPPSSGVAKTILNDIHREKIESEYAHIRRSVFWANHYRVGEYIPKHRDSEGDLQLIMPILLPMKENGGDFLIYKGDKPNVVELAVGQRFLFNARETFHETTKLVSSAVISDPSRVVCVCRIFFD